jgi:hypothetical protein
MSTVAAVVFSFVFTTNANAQSVENKQKNNLEVRVKTTSNENKQNGLEEFTDFVVHMFHTVFGVRV